ncbi:MAG: hypothetical protein V1650_01830 [Candidatus Omnitrophota bacterium]
MPGMYFLVIIASMSLLLGVMFMVSEDVIRKLEKSMNTVMMGANTEAIKNRKGIGVVLIVLAILLSGIYLRYSR